VYFHIVSYLCHPETFEYIRRLRRILQKEKSNKSRSRSWGKLRRLPTKSRFAVRWADLCEEEFLIEGYVETTGTIVTHHLLETY
jgi:hypothetical protein